MNTLKTLIGASGLIIALGGWSVANAYTFNFTSNTSSSSWGTPGNIRTFTASDNPSLSVTASAWYLSSSALTSTANQAYLGRFTQGLGVTNSSDETTQHYVDNSGRFDFVRFDFSEQVKVEKITLSIWSGDGDMTLGYGGSNNGSIFNHFYTTQTGDDLTIDFGSTPADETWRIFASLLNNQDGKTAKIDGFKIKSMEVSTVPLPAAVWLFGSALLGMVGIGYRRQNQNKPI